jgi:hypothetical protein
MDKKNHPWQVGVLPKTEEDRLCEDALCTWRRYREKLGGGAVYGRRGHVRRWMKLGRKGPGCCRQTSDSGVARAGKKIGTAEHPGAAIATRRHTNCYRLRAMPL